jgi:hypothetical protein
VRSSVPDERAVVASRLNRRRAVWAGRIFLGLAAVLAVWTVFLGFTLPPNGKLAHEDVVWVGFDIGLLGGLLATAWTSLLRNRFLPVAAAATATLLVMDAWFDVVGSSGADEMREAVAMAVLVELPLSAICWWIAIRAQRLVTDPVIILSAGLTTDRADPSGRQPGG